MDVYTEEEGYSKLKCNKEGCAISILYLRVKMPKNAYVIYERSFGIERGKVES